MNKMIDKLRLLLVMRLLEICAQNQGNSASRDLKCDSLEGIASGAR